MTRSEAYGTIDKGADDRELSWDLVEGLWPAERRAIEPPPPSVWRSAGPEAGAMRPFAPLPPPPRAVGASEPAPAWPAHIDSFFAPTESGAWARGVDPEPASWRPSPRPLPISVPPAPKIASAPQRAQEAQTPSPERAGMTLRLEEERDAGLPLERRVLGLSLRRSVCAYGAVLLGAVLIGTAIDWSRAERAATSSATPTPRAPSTDLSAVLQASPAPEPQPVALPAPSQPAPPPKRALRAGVARGSFHHQARPPRALPPSVPPDPAPAPEAPEAAPAPEAPQVGRSVTSAVPISSPRPRYPELARKRGIGGTVVVGFTIDDRGTVRDAAIESSDPAGVFDRAALQAIENTRYRPRLEDGEAVMTAKAKKRFTFRVRDRSAP